MAMTGGGEHTEEQEDERSRGRWRDAGRQVHHGGFGRDASVCVGVRGFRCDQEVGVPAPHNSVFVLARVCLRTLVESGSERSYARAFAHRAGPSRVEVRDEDIGALTHREPTWKDTNASACEPAVITNRRRVYVRRGDAARGDGGQGREGDT